MMEIVILIIRLTVGGIIGYLYSHKSSIKKEAFVLISNEKDSLAEDKIRLDQTTAEQTNKIIRLKTSLDHNNESISEQKEIISNLTSELNTSRERLAASEERNKTLIGQHAEKVSEVRIPGHVKHPIISCRTL